MEYMEALDIVDKGISHNRGRTLWELYSVRVYKLHTAFQLQGISADKFVRGLEGLLGMLAEVWISRFKVMVLGLALSLLVLIITPIPHSLCYVIVRNFPGTEMPPVQRRGNF